MPYLGNTPSTSFATVVKDSFSGDGSTVAFTLSKVATTNSVSVFVENVRQEPTTAYAVSGTTLTFTATTPSGTGNIYVLHMNPTTTTTHPAAQNLTAVDGTFTGNIDVDGTANLDVVDIDGALTQDGGAVFNEDSADVDFRVESNGNTHMLFVDGGNNRVGVGLSDPSDIFEVSNSADTPTRAIITAEDSSGSNQNAFIKTKAKGSYYEGLEMASTSGHIGMWGGYYSGSAVLQARVGGSGINSSDVKAIEIDANGHVAMPSQPAFLAYPNGDQSNMANDAVLVLDQEIYDQNADYNTSNYTFTAPVTGKYLMCVASRIDNADTSANWVRIELVTSNRSYSTSLVSPDVSPYMSIDYSIIVDMDASDTCFLRWGQSGGSATADMSDVTRWSGALIC